MAEELRVKAHAGDRSMPAPKKKWTGNCKAARTKVTHAPKRKVRLEDTEVEKDAITGFLWAIKHTSARLHRPTCDDAELSTQLAYSFGNLDLQRAWFAYVPRYVGEHKAVDYVARAVILAWRNRGQDSLPNAGMKYYAQAIQQLRISLDSSDLSLLCVALMANFETVSTASVNPMYPHVQGLAAIINARSKKTQTSDVARAVFYTFSDELFRLACSKNIPHPLDTPRHRNLEPPSRTTSKDEAVLSLRRTGFRLFVRLPRFISAFRAWQEKIDGGEMIHVPELLLLLARELLDLRNQEAEDQLLHRIGVVPTKDPETKKIMPYSFGFNYLSEVEAIGLYWEARLLIVSMCLRIQTLEECIQFGSGDTPRTPSGTNADLSKAKEEKQSSLANLLMAWQYTLTTPILAKDAIQALLIMWGAISDTEKFRHHSAVSIRKWILDQTRDIFRRYPSKTVDAEFMDKESGILFGRPLKENANNDLASSQHQNDRKSSLKS